MADFTGNGIDDLAVLTANGVSIYLGDGKGGFSSPVTYDAGVRSHRPDRRRRHWATASSTCWSATPTATC